MSHFIIRMDPRQHSYPVVSACCFEPFLIGNGFMRFYKRSFIKSLNHVSNPAIGRPIAGFETVVLTNKTPKRIF